MASHYEDDDAALAFPCSRLLAPGEELKPGLAKDALPGWLRAVAVVTEPDVLARLLTLLRNWANPHQGRPRVVLEFHLGPAAEPLATGAAVTVLIGDLAVFVPLLHHKGGDEARVAALIAQIEALACDPGVSKVLWDLRAEQAALTRLSTWRGQLEEEAAAAHQAAAQQAAAAAAAAIGTEEEREEGAEAQPQKQQKQEQKQKRRRRWAVMIDTDSDSDSYGGSHDEEEEPKKAAAQEKGKEKEEGKRGGAGDVAAGGAFLSMAHDLGLLFKEQLGTVLLGGAGNGSQKGGAGNAAAEERGPTLPEMLEGLQRVGRLSRADLFLALHAVFDEEARETKVKGEKEGEEEGGRPDYFRWGPAQEELLEEWAAEKEEEAGRATTHKQPVAEADALPAAPALLPPGTLHIDRTFLLFAVARAAFIAEAYVTVLGGPDAPQAQELLRPVARYRFRWGLDPGPAKEPLGVREARWRALCLDNVGREATQFLVRLQQEAQGAGAEGESEEEEDDDEEEGEEEAWRLLRIESPHLAEKRLLRVLLRFLNHWRQPPPPPGAAMEVEGGKRGRGAKRGRAGAMALAVDPSEAKEALLAAHWHRGGRLFLSSALVAGVGLEGADTEAEAEASEDRGGGGSGDAGAKRRRLV